MDMHPNARATGAARRWTPEEAEKPTSAVTNNSKTEHGKEYRSYCAVVVVVPERTDKWTPDEDIKLKHAAQKQDGENWAVIAARVPGRTEGQCRHRWHGALDPRVTRTTGHTGNWTTDEDTKLKDAVHIHGKDWDAIALLVPGRTRYQCCNGWQYVERKGSTVRK
jgi:hypothetical protein